ncbi:endoglucanase-like [Diorhabda carinulata]|uniref:endoglucanase-like n=1 Tax=Diorhabda carinulata TaxID=1163345 RepID=UPI0025A0278A|nr:endoglucanase-like [Diorhabda carinulata]
MNELYLLVCFLISSCVCWNWQEPSPDIIPVPGGLSGDAVTTRYWDCCGVSCSWDEIVDTKNGLPVRSCEIDGITNSTSENNAQSNCHTENGKAYTCSNQIPFIINSTLSYGFTAVSFIGGTDYYHCCSCYLLSFKGQLQGKQMLVQAINTGSDLYSNQFDLQIPGGGVGLYNGCSRQWNAPEDGWGDRYGGVHTLEECNQLPQQLQEGCRWRFEFMEGVPNPNVTFYEVKCPLELIAITNCGDID